MFLKTIPADSSHQLFLTELDLLLKKTGIAPSRQPIFAGADQKENHFTPSIEPYTPQVGRVVLYMEEHLSEELSLEELAREVQLSKYQLIRQFREEAGTTPWKYLIGRRIVKARQLLEGGVAPAQVAMETGFYDQSHMSRVFREETGLTPKEYQEQNFSNKN